MEHLSDEALMRLAQGPEPQRFGDLMRRHRAALLRTASQRLGRFGSPEDVVQETFLAAFRARATYQPAWSVRAWLWTILLNQCKAVWAKQAKQAARNEGYANRDDLAFDSPPADAAVEAREERRLLDEQLERLPTDVAWALRLRFFGGMKFQEIAETMNCSLGTAKNRVRAGLESLSRALTPPAYATDEEGNS
ncbi:MAG TPA: RNA polymerase sigma factor [Pirellulales bacterium]